MQASMVTYTRKCSIWPQGQRLPAAAPNKTYPARPVRVIVAFTAGGTTDILARAVALKLGEKLGQPFVIDNKPGGGGNIGTAEAVRATPDGYTLIVNSVGPMAINQTLYRKLPYDPLKDLVPVVQIADVPNVLVVHPSVPARSFEEFVAYLRANPGTLSYGHSGGRRRGGTPAGRRSRIFFSELGEPRPTCPATC
ncbi:hypothetical protein FQR65_LT19279 [Abscondita terminalis]|nr:hypothetical protein FQR65_LT19279 [Abscondita terminalis]